MAGEQTAASAGGVCVGFVACPGNIIFAPNVRVAQVFNLLYRAVSQASILQTDQSCQTVQVNPIGLRIKNLRYSPADARRRGTLRLRTDLGR